MRAILLAVLVGCGSPAAVEIDAPPPIAVDAPPVLGLTHVPLDGCGYSYTGNFALGDAMFRLMVDTGSNALAVAGPTCTSCAAAGAAPLYMPGATAVDLGKPGSATYDGGHISWQGELYTDLITTGDLPAVRLGFAEIASQQNFFSSKMCGKPQGILGMSPIVPDPMTTAFSYPTQLATAGAQDLFAMHLCYGTGDLWLDGYDPAATTAAPRWVDMTGAHTYNVALDDIAIDGTSIGVPAATYGTAVVDSGGPNLGVPAAAFSAITTMVAASPAFQARFGDASWFTGNNSCKILSETRAQLDAALPKLTVQIGTPPIAVELPATAAYVQAYPVTNGIAYCPAMFSSAFSDLGNTMMRAGVVIFDREHARLGVAPTTPCADTTPRAVISDGCLDSTSACRTPPKKM